MLSAQAQHGSALLWDAHSIASECPRFFAGRLTDFNLGTADGQERTAAMLEKRDPDFKGW